SEIAVLISAEKLSYSENDFHLSCKITDTFERLKTEILEVGESVSISEKQLRNFIESRRLHQMLLSMLSHSIHLITIGELHDVQHRAIRDLHCSEVDQVKKIEKLL
ncbi:hypothetical protein PMAYCL1PPCAC_24980, partial [Pristionchus mayeri]